MQIHPDELTRIRAIAAENGARPVYHLSQFIGGLEAFAACAPSALIELLDMLEAERERATTTEAEAATLRAIICEILGEFSSEMRYVPHDQEQRWRRAAGLSEIRS